MAGTAKKRASRAPQSQFPGSGLRVRVTEFEIKFLLDVFKITASVFRIRVSAFDYQDLELRIRIPGWQFEFPRSSSFSAWLPTSRTTDNTISRDGRCAGVASFGVPAHNRSGRSPINHRASSSCPESSAGESHRPPTPWPPPDNSRTGGTSTSTPRLRPK